MDPKQAVTLTITMLPAAEGKDRQFKVEGPVDDLLLCYRLMNRAGIVLEQRLTDMRKQRPTTEEDGA